jgi:hypothetical protein
VQILSIDGARSLAAAFLVLKVPDGVDSAVPRVSEE